MNSSVIIGAILLIGPILLVGCIAYGVLGFNPERANAIRSAEAEQPIVMEEIRRIHIRSPDRFRHDRMDRHPFYVALHLAVWGYAWCIFAGAPVTSNLRSLSPPTKFTMAACFIIGATLVLTGALMGAHLGRWVIIRGVRENMTSSMLADDIRLPYTFACSGLFAIGASMTIYAATSFGSTAGSLGGWMTALSAVACAFMIPMFFTRIRRYGRARATLIAAAVAQIERSHVPD